MSSLYRGWSVALAGAILLFLFISMPALAITISPVQPSVEDSLTCSFSTSVNADLAWYKNGQKVSTKTFTNSNPALVSYWNADDTVNDIIGTNNGVLKNGARYEQGISNNAFSFDGNKAIVEIPNSASLNPTNAMTIDLWVYPTGKDGQNREIIGKSDNFAQMQYLLTISDANRFRVHIKPSGAQVFFDSNTLVNYNKWYHLTMTYDGSFLKLYINGVLDKSVPVNGPIETGPQPIRIGNGAPGWEGAYAFVGRIDEIKIYSMALSGNEIKNSVFSIGDCVGSDCITDTLPNSEFKAGDAIYCSATPFIGPYRGSEVKSNEVKIKFLDDANTSLKIKIDAPVESLSLRDWLAPSGTFEWGGNRGWHNGVQSAYGYENYWNDWNNDYTGWSANLIFPEKVKADVAFTNPSHIYYRVLVKPDGSEQILDQYYFRGDQSTSTNPIAEFCKDTERTYDQYGREIETKICKTPYVTHYYNERTLPEKNIELSGEGKFKIEIRHIEIPGMTGRLHSSLDANSVIDIWDGSPQTIFTVSSGAVWDQNIFCKNKICTQDEQNKVNNYPCAGPITWMEESFGSSCKTYNQCIGQTQYYLRSVKCYNAGLKAKSVNLSTLAKTRKGYDFTIEPLAKINSISVFPEVPLTGDTLECDVDATGYTEISWYKNGQKIAVKEKLSPNEFSVGDKIACGARPVVGERWGAVVRSSEVVVSSMPAVSSISISPSEPTLGEILKCEVSATGTTEINWYANGNWISEGESLPADKIKSGDKIVCSATPFAGSRFGSEVVSKEIFVEAMGGAAISPFALAAGSSGGGGNKNSGDKNNSAPLLAAVGMGAVALAGAGALLLRRGTAVQPQKPQRTIYSKPSGEIKLNLVKNEIKTYTTNFLENVQARFAEMRETSVRLRNWFEGKQRAHEMDMQTARNNADAELQATNELKQSEKYFSTQLENKRAAAVAETMLDEEIRAKAQMSGGIPLMKIGNDFFRKDTGEFWSSVLPTLPRMPVELSVDNEKRPQRSGPNILKTISNFITTKSVSPITIIGKVESFSEYSSYQSHTTVGVPQTPPWLDQSRTMTDDEIGYVNQNNYNGQFSCWSGDYNGALLNVANGGVIVVDLGVQGTTYNLRMRSNRLYGQANVEIVDSNGYADWVAAHGGPTGSNALNRGFYNSGSQAGRSTMRTANKIDNLLRVGGRLLHALPFIGGLASGYDVYKEAKERGVDENSALYAGGAAGVATVAGDVFPPTSIWDTTFGIMSFGFAARGFATNNPQDFEMSERIDSITFSTNAKNVYVNQVTPRGYVNRREEELCNY